MSKNAVNHGLSIIRAGIEAVQADRLIESSGTLEQIERDVAHARRVFVIGAGKASMAMASVVEQHFGSRIEGGVVVVPSGYMATLPKRYLAPARIDVVEASHPLPDERGISAAGRALETAVHCEIDDLLLVLISGGASALWAGYAPGITLEDAAETTKVLLESGIPIQGMNIVRKHISSIGGGRLLEVAVPATIRALVVSDVVGDDLSSIGSGPCSPDTSTYSDALSIVQAKQLERRLPRTVIEHLRRGAGGLIPEPPKPGSAHEENADVHLIGTNKTALMAMADTAIDSGYRVAETLTEVTGEAREIGSEVGRAAADLQPGSCLIWGGETTVTVTGSGSGGRNHEVALAAAIELNSAKTAAVVLSAGTDGVDGSTDAAGAWSDARTIERGLALGVDARVALAKNNSGTFFTTIGQSIVTGPTHTNVTDIGIALKPLSPSPAWPVTPRPK